MSSGNLRGDKSGCRQETSGRKARRLRNQQIVAAHRRGLGPAALSAFFDLTPQHIGAILAKAEEEAVGPVSAADAERHIRAALEGIDQVIEDYAAEYERDTTHAGFRLGAIRGRMEALMLRLELQARSGLVPRHLAQPAQAAETAQLMADFAAVLKRHQASDEMLREVHEIAVRASGGRRERCVIEAAA